MSARDLPGRNCQVEKLPGRELPGRELPGRELTVVWQERPGIPATQQHSAPPANQATAGDAGYSATAGPVPRVITRPRQHQRGASLTRGARIRGRCRATT